MSKANLANICTGSANIYCPQKFAVGCFQAMALSVRRLTTCAVLLVALVETAFGTNTASDGSQELAALDAAFVAKLDQVTDEQEALAQRLDDSRRLVLELFEGEREETKRFVEDTRLQMAGVRDRLRAEMVTARLGVQQEVATAVANATAMIEQRDRVRAAIRDQLDQLDQLSVADEENKIQANQQQREEVVHWDWSKASEQVMEQVDWSIRGAISVGSEGLGAVSSCVESVVAVAVTTALWIGRQLKTLVVILAGVAVLATLTMLATVAIAKLRAYHYAKQRRGVVYSAYLPGREPSERRGRDEHRADKKHVRRRRRSKSSSVRQQVG